MRAATCHGWSSPQCTPCPAEKRSLGGVAHGCTECKGARCIEGDGAATRYGANVGRQGFLWNGNAYVGRKSEWATWTPPKEMIRRQPEAAKYARGMPGGLDNPLGARTLHLYQNGAYTLYTIYASSDAESIGTGITSGCVGLLSQDMIHLYAQTPVKTKVVVLPA